MYNDPKLHKLPKDAQIRVLGRVYDKIVAPWYERSGLKKTDPTFPSKEDWLMGRRVAEPLQKSTIGGLFNAAVTETAGGMVEGATNIAKTATKYQSLGLADTSKFKKAEDLGARLKEAGASYFADHYIKTYADKLAMFAGEQFASLPAYIIAGKLTPGSLGLISKEVQELFPLIYKGVQGASFGYLSSLMMGEGQLESLKSGANFAALDVATAKTAKSLDPAIAYIGRLLGIGGRRAVEGALDAGDKSFRLALGAGLKSNVAPAVTDPIAVAGKSVLDTFSQKLYQQPYGKLGTGSRIRVVKSILGLIGDIEPNVAAYNKDMITAAVKKDIAKDVATNPDLKQTIDLFKKVGINLEEETVNATIKAADAKVGRSDSERIVRRLANPSLEEKRKAGIDLLKEELGWVGPGAESIYEPKMQDLVFALAKKNNILLESKDQQLLQSYQYRKNLDRQVPGLGRVIEKWMRNRFPGEDAAQLNARVEQQKARIADVQLGNKEGIPEIAKHGPNLFRSAPLEPGAHSKWSKELEDLAEAKRIELATTNPIAKAAVKKTKATFDKIAKRPRNKQE